CIHRWIQRNKITANPHAHTQNRIAGTGSALVLAAARMALKSGCATSPVTNEIAGRAIKGALGVHPGMLTCPPRLTNTPNGTRNFTSAASQTQYLMRAEFLLSSSVSSPIAPAKKVDCQRCAAITMPHSFAPAFEGPSVLPQRLQESTGRIRSDGPSRASLFPRTARAAR